MAIRNRILAGLASLALVLPLSGCTVRTIHVVIPDFFSHQVEGVNVFRLDDTTGAPVAAGQIDFVSSSTQSDGTQLVGYQIVASDGSTSQVFPAYLTRNPSNPDSAELELLYDSQVPAGWFKVSTFNPYGASALSTAQTYLN